MEDPGFNHSHFGAAKLLSACSAYCVRHTTHPSHHHVLTRRRVLMTMLIQQQTHTFLGLHIHALVSKKGEC